MDIIIFVTGIYLRCYVGKGSSLDKGFYDFNDAQDLQVMQIFELAYMV